MDWFRRQRRAKKVTGEDDTPALPAPADEQGDESEEAEAVAITQPLLVELTPPLSTMPPTPLALETPEPLRVEITTPLPGPIEIPQPLRVELAQPQPSPSSPEPDVKAILAAEFAYIAQTTIQNNEDRVSAFFYTSAAAVIAAAVGLKLDTTTPGAIYATFGVIFGVMVVLGRQAILQLAQLRAGWFSSIRAMNRIKRYYYSVYPELAAWQPSGDAARDLPADAEETRGVFLWMKEPARDKRESIAYLRVMSIAIIDWLFAAAAVTLLFISRNPAEALGNGNNLFLPLGVGVVLGGLVCLFLRNEYFRAVQKD